MATIFNNKDHNTVSGELSYGHLPDIEDSITETQNRPYTKNKKSPSTKNHPLVASDTRFRKLIENSYEGITLLNKSLKVIYRSASAQRINGWKTADRVNNKLINLTHPDDKRKVNNILKEVLLNPGTAITCTFRSRHFNGHYIWLECIFTNFLNDPDINSIVCNFRNITEIKQKAQLVEDILESINDGFISLDKNGCYTYANKQIGKMLGRDPGSLIGKNIWEVFPDAVNSATYIAIQSAIKENQYVCNEDYYAPLNLWQENRVYPSNDGVSVFIRDITKRKTGELQKALLAEISFIFNEGASLKESLNRVLIQLIDYGNFSLTEFWLVDKEQKKINLTAQFSKNEHILHFINETAQIKSFSKGMGLPGLAWETHQLQYWHHTKANKGFLRMKAAKKAGSKRAYAVPLLYNDDVIGVLCFIMEKDELPNLGFSLIFENFSTQFGAEIKRKQIEEELNQVFNLSPDIICTTGFDGYIRKINPAGCRLLEFTEEELLSRPFLDHIHPNDKQKSIIEFENLIKGKEVFNFEIRCITGSEKTIWLSWTIAPANDEGLLFCVAKNVTDKKEAEELLTKATSLARIGAWEVDLKKKMVYWSDITREIHEAEPGFNPDIEAAVNFYNGEQNRKTIIKIMERAIKTGTTADTELQIITAKGNIKWVRVIVETEFINTRCARLYGSFQDIDERKKATIAINEALNDRATILESIGDAFFAVDENWVVTYWNNMAEKVLGRPKDEILNCKLWDVYADSINSLSYIKYNEALNAQQSVHFEDHYEPLGKWYEISAYPSKNGLSVYFKDITERKNSEIHLKELNEDLKKHAKELAISNAELEQFAYVASHDLQEPLRMITSFLTQLEKKYGDVVDEKGKQYINFAVDGAKRMRQIILDLLEFSRVGGVEDDFESVDLNKIVNDTIALYRRKIEDKQAKITFDNLPTLYTCKTPLRQVIRNLISNSLKYHKAGVAPMIHISGKEFPSYWDISVKDNGIGIEGEFFNKIFIIFHQLHPKNEYSGTGMGLAIAKKIVENWGGNIWVKSTEGVGSTFHFTILKSNKQ